MNDHSGSEPFLEPGAPPAPARLRGNARAAPETGATSLLVPGETCWRIETAHRIGVLIDTAEYFRALRSAIVAAHSHVVIIGWDVDSRTNLAPDNKPSDGLPATLLPFLKAALKRRPELHVYIVAWDFSVIYTLEREFLPSFTFSHVHPRLHFVLDDEHALGASQHQKLVVIDDRLAFVGGMDLTIRRWDRPAHAATEKRRVDPNGEAYGPMHDLQLCLDGPAACALAELAWHRWDTAITRHPQAFTRISTTRSSLGDSDAWPDRVRVDFADIQVGICRTHEGTLEQPRPTREIEAVTRAALLAAQRYVYIENQYLTSSVATRAIAQSLQAPTGPQFVVVLPKVECGWLEQSSMGMLRQRVLAQLRAADPHGRLHVYYPKLPQESQHSLNVHSKLLVVDGNFLKLGSANLSNRSLGLDTECDIAIEASGPSTERTRRDITAIVQRLLAEHLDLSVEQGAAGFDDGASLVEFIEAYRGRPRCLEPLPETQASAPIDLAAIGDWVFDPERPMAAETFIASLFPAHVRHPLLRSALACVAMLVPVLVLSFLRHHNADSPSLQHALFALRDPVYAALCVGVSYALGCLLFAPITVLLAATVVLFEPLPAFGFGFCGAMLGATLTYTIGRIWRRPTLRYLRQRPAWHLYRSLHERALRATVLARLLPAGNFTGSNLLAGALNLAFWRFACGNAIGLSLGIAWLVWFAHALASTFREPSLLHVLQCCALAGTMLGLCFILARVFAATSGTLQARRDTSVARRPSMSSAG